MPAPFIMRGRRARSEQGNLILMADSGGRHGKRVSKLRPVPRRCRYRQRPATGKEIAVAKRNKAPTRSTIWRN